MEEFIVQRVVMPPELRLRSLYFQARNPDPARRSEPRPLDRRALALDVGTAACFFSYFNAFFEPPWRRYTHLRRLHLRLRLSGCGTVRLWRRSATTGTSVLSTVEVAGEEQELRIDVPAPAHPCEQGAVYFELLARRGPLVLHDGEWIAEGSPARRVGLVGCYCTHNRSAWLLANLRALLGDTEVAERLLRLVVVDQGSERLRQHPEYASLPDGSGKLHLVEQGNYGGSGGFARAILEASEWEGASHILLMDDDAVLEPESVLRTAAFLALARQDLAVGGQMLDAVRPFRISAHTARLAPENLNFRFVVKDLDLGPKGRGMRSLLRVQPTHFNCWWFLAFPLSAVQRGGLPMPFFIHFDDIEFGLRLTQLGVPTVAVPGIGVWHEPSNLKRRRWTPYYGYRNALITYALHAEISARLTCLRTVGRLLVKLLALDYYSAWALCEAVQDYRRGPEALERDPQQTQRRILHAHAELKPETLSRSPLLSLPACRSRLRTPAPWRQGVELALALLRQFLRRSPPAGRPPDIVIRPKDEHWWAVGRRDVVAIDDPYSEEVVVLRRSRGRFLRLLLRGCWEAARLWWSHGRVVRQWRDGFARLVSREQWLRYLGQTPALLSQKEGKLPDHNLPGRHAA